MVSIWPGNKTKSAVDSDVSTCDMRVLPGVFKMYCSSKNRALLDMSCVRRSITYAAYAYIGMRPSKRA